MYRVVHNETTDRYRVEKRGLLGWSFVVDPSTHDYLDFGDLGTAKTWVQEHTNSAGDSRRWKVVTDCAV